MDAGRLAQVLTDAVAEAATVNLQALTQGLVGSLTNAVNAPQQPAHAQQFKNSLDQLYDALGRVPSNDWPPSKRQILESTGLSTVTGLGLRHRIQTLLAEDGLLKTVALQKLQEVFSEQQTKFNQATQAATALKGLGVSPSETPTEGVEVGFLLPNSIDTSNLSAVEKELKTIDRLLRTLAEATGETPASAKVIGINSGSLKAFVLTGYGSARLLLDIVDRVLNIWQRTIDLRKQERALKQLGVPAAAVDPLSAHIDQQVSTDIEQYVEELIAGRNLPDGGRRNELRNSLRICLKELAIRIDRGEKIEASVQPAAPQADGQHGEPDQAELIQQIMTKGALMRDTPQLDQPILALAEPTPETPTDQENV